MDVNLILLFVSVLTSVSVTLQVLRVRQPALLLSPAIVLSAAAIGYAIDPDRAGFVAGGACALFMVIPLYAAVPMTRALAAQRFKVARNYARLSAALNPIPARFRTLRAIALLEAVELGQVRLAELDPRTLGPEARSAYIQALRAERRYDDIVAYCRSISADERSRDSSLLAYEVRALGEGRRYAEMVELAKLIQSRPDGVRINDDVRLMALAFLGQVELTNHFAARRAHILGAPVVGFWQAIALWTAGDARGIPMLETLTHSTHSAVRRAAQRALEQSSSTLDLSALPSARAYVDEVAAEVASAAGMEGAQGRAIATLSLIGLVTAAFCAQVPGGITDLRNLVDLGALVVPKTAGFDQPWRLLSAAFLHFGFAHFAMNMLGLWVFGKRIEGALGSFRLAVVFVGSAIFGNEAAILFMKGPAVVVGASGGVLGLLGALVGIVLQRRRSGSTRYLQGVLREVAGIAVMQVAFDLTMPNIGSTVHLGGFVAGVVLGAMLTPSAR